MNTPAKPRFSRHTALIVANELCALLRPHCERMIIAGSLRRGKQWVGDVEILFISKAVTRPKSGDMFADETVSPAQIAIAKMLEDQLLTKRLKSDGTTTWGDQNKLATHVPTKVPVDLFHTTEAAWFNCLVCRTGSAAHNVTIATRAQHRGWKWNPYSPGFTHEATGEPYAVTSEEDLFRFLAMEFKAPKDR